jgi:hypothetical protein
LFPKEGFVNGKSTGSRPKRFKTGQKITWGESLRIAPKQELKYSQSLSHLRWRFL